MLPEKGFTTRNVLFVGGLGFALFQLVLPVFVHLIDLELRALHVLFGISLAFFQFPFRAGRERRRPGFWTWLAAAAVAAATLNVFFKAMDIYARPGTADTVDLALGAVLFVLVLAMAYRYVFVLLELLQDLLLARRSRSLAPARDGEHRRWLGVDRGAAGTATSGAGQRLLERSERRPLLLPESEQDKTGAMG